MWNTEKYSKTASEFVVLNKFIILLKINLTKVAAH